LPPGRPPESPPPMPFRGRLFPCPLPAGIARRWPGRRPMHPETTAQGVAGGASGGQRARALWNPERIFGGCRFRREARKDLQGRLQRAHPGRFLAYCNVSGNRLQEPSRGRNPGGGMKILRQRRLGPVRGGLSPWGGADVRAHDAGILFHKMKRLPIRAGAAGPRAGGGHS